MKLFVDKTGRPDQQPGAGTFPDGKAITRLPEYPGMRRWHMQNLQGKSCPQFINGVVANTVNTRGSF
jgi:hypothetical protein